MLLLFIEALVICILFTLTCMFLVGRVTDNLELVKLNYPPEIVQRLIDLGMVSGDKPLPLIQRLKKKWPAMIVMGVLLGLIVRFINGCETFLSGFGTSYLLWLIVDWYDALILDCVWFCHSKRCVIPGTEDLTDAYRDYMFHIKGSCVGMLIGIPCCLIAAVIAAI